MARVAETIGFGADAADGGGGSLNLVGPIRWMAPESLRPVKVRSSSVKIAFPLCFHDKQVCKSYLEQIFVLDSLSLT